MIDHKKYNPIAMVTVRMSSARLPGKPLQTIAGDVVAIQVVIQRAKKIGCQVVLTTTIDASDDPLATIARQEDVACFRGAVKNKIRRWADCFEKFDASIGLLVDGDDPTFDYDVGARAIEFLRTTDADFITHAPEMTPGFFTYGISRNGMEKLLEQAPDPNTDTDVITAFVEKAGLIKDYLPALPEERAGHDLRLTIDYPEDVAFYRALFAKIDYLASGPETVKVAQKNKLQDINLHRHDEFLKNQEEFVRKTR